MTRSIVTENSKNGILIAIAKSTELHLMRILNILVLPIQSYEPEKNCLIYENMGNHSLIVVKPKLRHSIQRIREPYLRSYNLLSRKMWNIFSRSDHIEPVILECCEQACPNGNEVIVPFLSDPKKVEGA